MNHLFERSDINNQEIFLLFDQFKRILYDSSLDQIQKEAQLDNFLLRIKKRSNRINSDRKLETLPTYITYSDKKSNYRFNNSILLVETKLFANKFQEHTQEIEKMLQQIQ
ncbi:hypothetical protein pb186bvf_001247 [Paramecium bursaria]